MQNEAYLYLAEAPVFFIITVCSEPSPYIGAWVYGQFCIDNSWAHNLLLILQMYANGIILGIHVRVVDTAR
jgi:hypothetical protein